ncbi:hypothetical protein [Lentilactobacillus sp. Marseille-Q4993]|uniref:hypothetical protein n=1 Tax=Lentilactobacillus sp. Marseille-Q4993 TaxID=3039492 RepID=UPI0024BCC281|nr:hypothetical protein [Lentilactobacillus sp. Marseille-Q4993]
MTNNQKPLKYRTKVDVKQLLNNRTVMSIKVPTIQARKEAQRLIENSVDQGITPYYLKDEAKKRLSGSHYE